jgi:MarR family transcriptional regulator, temperature-dependent positive regulator of motility
VLPHEEARLRILKIVSREPNISQRHLAIRLGISLGKTNFLIRSLLEKGLIKAGNFKRSEYKLQYAYLLTPKGLIEKVRMTRAYLARKEAEYEALQAEIQGLRQEMRSNDELR